MKTLNQRVAIAPMMDWTDRHYRYFMRLISRHVVLYTEMVTTGALLHGDTQRFLAYDDLEHPLILQLGGSDPKALAHCAKLAESQHYDGVNLNVGCPSDRVQSGRFGACLMKEPDLVAQCVTAMQEAVSIPVSVKTRLGVDDMDSYQALAHFIDTVSRAGCESFILHARKAWLKGLSPKQNREVPPLRYDIAEQIKQDFPQLEIIVNGGIKDISSADEEHQNFDGIMIGREAYHNPYALAGIDQRYYGSQAPQATRFEIIKSYLPYIEKQLSAGVPLNRITRHILGLFQGVTGAKAWRRTISERAHKKSAGIEVIEAAMAGLF